MKVIFIKKTVDVFFRKFQGKQLFFMFICFFLAVFLNFSLFAKNHTKILSKQKDQVKTLIKERIDDSKVSGILGLSGLGFKNIKILSKLPKDCYEKIKEIKLNNNKIKQITANSFTPFKKLKNLDLSNNQIDRLDEKSFNGCKKIKYLSLESNRLFNLPKKLLWNLYDLEIFDVSDNELQVLDKNLFKNCKKLKKVNLADNNLKFISPKLFQGKLKELNIHGNKIEGLSIPSDNPPIAPASELDMW